MRLSWLMMLFVLILIVAVPVFAETVEFVTYYPAPGSGDLHVNSLTVGSDYSGVTPADGEALFVGPVGIGTDNPQALLDIYQQDEAYLRISGTGINATPENFSGIELGSDLPAGGPIDRLWQIAHKRGGAGAVNDLHLNYFDGAAWSTKMAFLPDGNVGIGTATPVRPLHVRRDLQQPAAGQPWLGQIVLEPASASSAGGAFPAAGLSLVTNYGAGRTWTLLAGSGNAPVTNFRIYDSTADMDRLVIDANGNVGIGTTTPDALLTLAGASGNAGGFLRLKDQFGNARALYMTSNNYTLGFWCPANYATLSNTGVWTDASDRAYKKGIAPLRYGLNEVLQLKPRQYQMKADNTPQVGFIAQEVREVIPEVIYGEEPNLNLSYDQMLPVVVKAVQQLKAENDDLRARNGRLEARVKALEGK